MKLFEYAIVFNPNEAEKKEGVKGTLILAPKYVLGDSVGTVTMLAAREIPESYLDKLDRVEVAVRPF